MRQAASGSRAASCCKIMDTGKHRHAHPHMLGPRVRRRALSEPAGRSGSICLIWQNTPKSLIAAAIFVMILRTDWRLMGIWREVVGEVTDFGKFMDPLADKIPGHGGPLGIDRARIASQLGRAQNASLREFIVSGACAWWRPARGAPSSPLAGTASSRRSSRWSPSSCSVKESPAWADACPDFRA